jgi:hypothetical protein
MAMVYALLRSPRARVAHLADGDFQPALCGRPVNLTSNVPWGRRTCRDCMRIANTTEVRRVPISSNH